MDGSAVVASGGVAASKIVRIEPGLFMIFSSGAVVVVVWTMFLGGPAVQSGSEADSVGRRDGPSTLDGETTLQSAADGGGGLVGRECDIVFCMLEF